MIVVRGVGHLFFENRIVLGSSRGLVKASPYEPGGTTLIRSANHIIAVQHYGPFTPIKWFPIPDNRCELPH